MSLTAEQLPQKCEDILENCSLSTVDKDQIDYIEKSTVGQSDNLLWYEMTAGRITASIAHQAK